MSSAAPESESAGLLPSQSRVSDHDSSRDERVVTVEPVTAAAASSAAPSDASSPIGSKSDDMSGIVGPLKSALEGLKFQIACMPVLRLKVPSRARCNPQILVPPASTFAALAMPIVFFIPTIFFPTSLSRCSRPRAVEPICYTLTRSAY
jgi:hypothetical protein